jgi:dienelactone hydrolase
MNRFACTTIGVVALLVAEVQPSVWQTAAPSHAPIRDGGIVGTLSVPAPGGRHPAVIVVGGSEGGVEWSAPWGEPLSVRGFVVLALAYFASDTLPERLQDIPLEYFKRAIDRLRAHPSVDPARIAIIGFSKGAEAALLVAATYPEIKAVVVSAPSHVAWPGITGDPTRTRPSWTLAGRPLPFLTYDLTQPFTTMLDAYSRSLRKTVEADAAAIPVERIGGPVLLFSGTDDRVWPSTTMADLIVERLARSRFPHAYEHTRYEGAGHPVLGAPPVTPVAAAVPAGALVRLGGTSEINAKAREESWSRTLAFLERVLMNSTR